MVYHSPCKSFGVRIRILAKLVFINFCAFAVTCSSIKRVIYIKLDILPGYLVTHVVEAHLYTQVLIKCQRYWAVYSASPWSDFNKNLLCLCLASSPTVALKKYVVLLLKESF